METKISSKVFAVTFSGKRSCEICIFDLDPGNATLNITTTEVNSTKVNISWNPLPVCSQGADDLEYELEVKYLKSNITVKNYINTTSYIFMGFPHYQPYEITLTPTNKHGKGAPSTKTSTTPEGCKFFLSHYYGCLLSFICLGLVISNLQSQGLAQLDVILRVYDDCCCTDPIRCFKY